MMRCNLVISDFTVPLHTGGQSQSAEPAVSEEDVTMIVSMGFTKEQAIKALRATVSAK